MEELVLQGEQDNGCRFAVDFGSDGLPLFFQKKHVASLDYEVMNL